MKKIKFLKENIIKKIIKKYKLNYIKINNKNKKDLIKKYKELYLFDKDLYISLEKYEFLLKNKDYLILDKKEKEIIRIYINKNN